MKPILRVLIVGGYGTFGGRLVQLLENEPRLTLIVAGRSLAKSRAWCAARTNARATLIAAAFDREGDLEQQLGSLNADLLVDASGPFQQYGAQPYRLIQACITHRISYLDLADGSDFVAAVKQFDVAAREAGIFILSGVSSFPVLTAAVVRRLSTGFATVDSIRGGIAPSPYAGVGDNVIRAIASYAGQPIRLRREGAQVTAYPFTESVRYTVAPPGRVPLRPLRFSLVDVPDLRALADLWPEAKTIWMGAGPVPALLHRALTLFAWLVRARLIPSLLPLVPLISFVMNHVRWGEHRGGMFVEVVGTNARGASVKRSWHLIAEADDGPLIPSMALEAIIRRLLNGKPPVSGARAAVCDLEVEDYEAIFADRRIFTGVRYDDDARSAVLYARVLKSAWRVLPPEIQQLHSVESSFAALGRCSVERGKSLFARFIAWIFGFPEEGSGVDLQVRFEVRDGVEVWTRTFADRSFSSTQSEGRGRSEHLLCERFGPFSFAIALLPKHTRMDLVLRGWTAFGIPMPLWLGPWSNSYEYADDRRFRFDVQIGHPVAGLIVRYRGWLMPTTTLPAYTSDLSSASVPAHETASASGS